jgi:phosphopantothenoylcysteine decarboxylase/phosphopantothenate--cysteine ligase
MVNHKSKIHILITAGGTREYIDPVRFISNASSGKMGYALARVALKAGHKVTLITAPTALKPPKGVRVVKVETTAEMFDAVKERFPKCDCLIMAAAVADFTPVRRSRTKIKKEGGLQPTLRLKRTPDILKWAGAHKISHLKSQIPNHPLRRLVVGFALEDRNLRANAEKKLHDKHLDMIVANTPAAIAADKSTLHVKAAASDWLEVSNASKATSARQIIRTIEARMEPCVGGSGKR